jgi:hypothetical protein
MGDSGRPAFSNTRGKTVNARVKFAAAVAILAVIGMGTAAVADDVRARETLTGYEEVPALSTPGVGDFDVNLNQAGDALDYTLTFSGLETAATQAHIHFENRTNNGPIVVFLCSNLPGAPAGTQACPAAGGTITGTITAANVGAGAAGQGIAAGEFEEFVQALRSGATYVNVHSVGRPGGEIRAQLDDNNRGDG